MTPIHTCSCGRRYTADEWARLPLVGVQHVPAGDDGPEEWQEMRNCTCGSTRSRTLPAELDEVACQALLEAAAAAEWVPDGMPSVRLLCDDHEGWRVCELVWGSAPPISYGATPFEATRRAVLVMQRRARELKLRRCA